jgi:type II secretory pathway component PulK
MIGRKAGKMVSPLRTERGTALVLTLLIITTLAGLTIGFSGESGVELTLAGYSRDSYRAYLVARSGIDAGMALLADDEDLAMDSLNEDWARLESMAALHGLEEEGITVSGGVVDESGKINVNLLRNEDGEIDETREEQIRRLFLVLGLKDEMLNPLLDWLDADDVERQDGAEAYFYQDLDEPYPCANGPFLTPGQIFLVKGMGKLQRFEGKKASRLPHHLFRRQGQHQHGAQRGSAKSGRVHGRCTGRGDHRVSQGRGFYEHRGPQERARHER